MVPWLFVRANILPVAHVREVALDRRGSGHGWRHQVGAASLALAAFEIAVARRGAAFARPKLVWIHSQAHAAARLAPLESGLQKNTVQPLRLRLLLHFAASRHNHRLHTVGHT